MRVLVIGSGLGGLTAALTADAAGHDVTVLTKARIDDANTAWAQGGIAVAMGTEDSPALHAADTMVAGADVNDPLAVAALTESGAAVMQFLLSLGVPFDRAADGSLERGQEAAHSLRRVFHAGGDATGAAIERALVAAVRERGIAVNEGVALEEFVVANGRVVGAQTLDARGVRTEWPAEAVILASGGAGQLYRFTTNPSVATGDGIAAAWRAGAVLHDMEFVQFHPTALATGHSTLVSEAVRGEGAVLRNRAGERFMLRVHPDAELAPRDVVARAIAAEMAAQDGQPVWLDATVIRPRAVNGRDCQSVAEFLAARFPSIDAACQAAGLDWASQWIPVAPAAHYLMGGVVTDVDGHSSLPGLWAVGEVANTGVHGANRLASNSLLEAAVFGRRAADSLSDHLRSTTPLPYQRSLSEAERSRNAEAEVETPHSHTAPQRFSRAALQALMWEQVGLTRSEPGLALAARQIASWQAEWADRVAATVAEAEDRNLLDVASAVVAAARARTESLGAHYRSDEPAVLRSLSPSFVGVETHSPALRFDSALRAPLNERPAQSTECRQHA